MGALLARFRKRQTTIEILEGIDKDIERLVRLKRRNVELEKHYMGSLLLYSVIGYLVMALFFYFLYEATLWQERLVQILPLLLFPVLIWLIRKALHWYFVKRIARNDLALEDLRIKRKNILEDVKENESYKKAKEILEKFDPSSTLPPLQTPSPGSRQTPTPALRQRPQSARGGRGRGRGSPSTTTPRAITQRGHQPMLQTPQAAMLRSPGTVRPVLSREQTTFDKMVGYLVGDGPGSRYALICRHCYSHNGMALKEEFEFLAFRCAYCGTFNPSKKVRPNAPKLPETPAVRPLRPMQPLQRRSSGSIHSSSEISESDTESSVHNSNSMSTELPTTASEAQLSELTPAPAAVPSAPAMMTHNAAAAAKVEADSDDTDASSDEDLKPDEGARDSGMNRVEVENR